MWGGTISVPWSSGCGRVDLLPSPDDRPCGTPLRASTVEWGFPAGPWAHTSPGFSPLPKVCPCPLGTSPLPVGL